MSQLHKVIHQIVTSSGSMTQIMKNIEGSQRQSGLTGSEASALSSLLGNQAHIEAWLSVDSLKSLVAQMDDEWPMWVPPVDKALEG